MLSSNQYVRVFVIDFSKAFDSIRRNQLFAKMSSLSIPDEIYNWINHFFTNRGHCTKFGNDLSTIAEINASVVQGSDLARPHMSPPQEICNQVSTAMLSSNMLMIPT